MRHQRSTADPLPPPAIRGAPPTQYYQLFLDAGLNHSSGYFTHDDVSLERAQLTKIDAILDRCHLRDHMLLLDVGCGWGATVLRAVERHGTRAIGLTVQPEQHAYAADSIERAELRSKAAVRLQRWEDFDERVDRIVCINSFENFSNKRQFFAHCRKLLPPEGILVVLTVTAERPVFRTLSHDEIIRLARGAGFAVEASASLAPHYVRTLDCFVDRLQRRREEAIALTSSELFESTVRYYTRCSAYLRNGANDMFEFILRAPTE